MGDPAAKEYDDATEQLAKLVHVALLQAGDMQDIQKKAEELADRSAKFTPLPETKAE